MVLVIARPRGEYLKSYGDSQGAGVDSCVEGSRHMRTSARIGLAALDPKLTMICSY
jgi:hypothetical protein